MITLLVRGGPMNGQRFVADLAWPPPDHLFGGDIHRSMIGTYELSTLWEAEQVAEYRLRADGNYRQILAGWVTFRAKQLLTKEER